MPYLQALFQRCLMHPSWICRIARNVTLARGPHSPCQSFTGSGVGYRHPKYDASSPEESIPQVRKQQMPIPLTIASFRTGSTTALPNSGPLQYYINKCGSSICWLVQADCLHMKVAVLFCFECLILACRPTHQRDHSCQTSAENAEGK